MTRIFAAMVGAGLLLGVAGPASAFEVCFGYLEFGNQQRIEFTPLGSFFALNGRDRTFAERAITGTAYVEPGTNKVRLGFSVVGRDGGTAFDGFQNTELDLATFSGPVIINLPAVNVDRTGTIVVIACTPTTGAEPAGGLPDAFAR